MVVAHNLAAMNTQRQFGLTNVKKAKSAEKLASGYKINRAADDAAGLAMSEKMRRQVRGLSQASLNAQEGISLVQVADGAMDEIHEMLQRGNELAIKAANGNALIAGGFPAWATIEGVTLDGYMGAPIPRRKPFGLQMEQRQSIILHMRLRQLIFPALTVLMR